MLPINVSPLAGASRPAGINESGKPASGMHPLPPEPAPGIKMGLGGGGSATGFGTGHEFSLAPYGMGHRKRMEEMGLL